MWKKKTDFWYVESWKFCICLGLVPVTSEWEKYILPFIWEFIYGFIMIWKKKTNKISYCIYMTYFQYRTTFQHFFISQDARVISVICTKKAILLCLNFYKKHARFSNYQTDDSCWIQTIYTNYFLQLILGVKYFILKSLH